MLAELFLRMAEEIGYSAERLPDVFSQMSVWLAKDAENDSFGKKKRQRLQRHSFTVQTAWSRSAASHWK